MTEETFAETAREVTAPGYQRQPLDEELAIFLEHAQELSEFRDSATADEFDDFCRENEWMGGTGSEVAPLLDALRKWWEEA